MTFLPVFSSRTQRPSGGQSATAIVPRKALGFKAKDFSLEWAEQQKRANDSMMKAAVLSMPRCLLVANKWIKVSNSPFQNKIIVSFETVENKGKANEHSYTLNMDNHEFALFTHMMPRIESAIRAVENNPKSLTHSEDLDSILETFKRPVQTDARGMKFVWLKVDEMTNDEYDETELRLQFSWNLRFEKCLIHIVRFSKNSFGFKIPTDEHFSLSAAGFHVLQTVFTPKLKNSIRLWLDFNRISCRLQQSLLFKYVPETSLNFPDNHESTLPVEDEAIQDAFEDFEVDGLEEESSQREGDDSD